MYLIWKRFVCAGEFVKSKMDEGKSCVFKGSGHGLLPLNSKTPQASLKTQDLPSSIFDFTNSPAHTNLFQIRYIHTTPQ